ncbi:MAG TPA: hypothetical protein VMW28_02500 [Pelolinea sp.]|nr:hypothetical protein [Pelolinea sp.]
MRGFSNLMATVGIEALVGSSAWFSQALCPNNFQVSALGQAGLDGKGASLNWLLPVAQRGRSPLPELLDHIALEAGLRGARFITAGAHVDNCLFETLRRTGYCTYSWHCIWELQVRQGKNSGSGNALWSHPETVDAIAIETLQRRLLSPSVQSVTEFATQKLPDFILIKGGEISGYAYVECFNNKALIKPFLERNIEDAQSILRSLIADFFHLADTVYIRLTSDQIWLSRELDEIAYQILPREELLVKHFAAVEKLPVANLNHAHNGRRTDTVTPIMPSANHQDNL